MAAAACELPQPVLAVGSESTSILPAFGVYSEVVATFCGKRLFGYTSLVIATASIAILSFTVWLHHFFTMGASANVNAFFGLATMIIAVPTGVKVFDWLLTMFRGRIVFHHRCCGRSASS
jgi:cytochrome o ubiquinol oxidase subunit 1